VSGDLGDVRTLADTAQLLRALSGLYDQAARAAASL
jgi:predicted MarR family transcription regulator